MIINDFSTVILSARIVNRLFTLIFAMIQLVLYLR